MADFCASVYSGGASSGLVLTSSVQVSVLQDSRPEEWLQNETRVSMISVATASTVPIQVYQKKGLNAVNVKSAVREELKSAIVKHIVGLKLDSDWDEKAISTQVSADLAKFWTQVEHYAENPPAERITITITIGRPPFVITIIIKL